MRKIQSCREYFDTVQERFLPEHAPGVEAIIVYKLIGPEGGTWTIRVDNGKISVEEGGAINPTVIYNVEAQNFIDLANGDLNGAKAFALGKLKVSGSLQMAQRISKFLP
ncbi:MAG: SCP2 sterol-binding domain-containing protein [Verrucomicrobia bacterium]|nr:SCP2 sterol-binding domain-containing protein [Verrucomicrobiota bacterium]